MEALSKRLAKIEFPVKKNITTPEISDTRTLGEIYELRNRTVKSVSLSRLLKRVK